jgi:hypothetical protein
MDRWVVAMVATLPSKTEKIEKKKMPQASM